MHGRQQQIQIDTAQLRSDPFGTQINSLSWTMTVAYMILGEDILQNIFKILGLNAMHNSAQVHAWTPAAYR